MGRDNLILYWRKMKRIKLLKPINKAVFIIASSNCFNIFLDSFERNIMHDTYDESRIYFKNNRTRVKENISALKDEKSKAVYKNLIKYRMTHIRKYISGKDSNQYFDEHLIKWKEKEYFIDCGAYDGDTIKQFSKRMKIYGADWRILAFEPDNYNYQQLKKFIKSDETLSERVEIYPIGTWSRRADLRFQRGMDDSSRISGDGESIIKADKIDQYVSGKYDVSFIKMDIEGAELESLKGAEQTILKYHPRLAISIYHSDHDMVDIIEYIRKKFPFYDLYVRHYTWFFADTVCYAIDKENRHGDGVL